MFSALAEVLFILLMLGICTGNDSSTPFTAIP